MVYKWIIYYKYDLLIDNSMGKNNIYVWLKKHHFQLKKIQKIICKKFVIIIYKLALNTKSVKNHW